MKIFKIGVTQGISPDEEKCEYYYVVARSQTQAISKVCEFYEDSALSITHEQLPDFEVIV